MSEQIWGYAAGSKSYLELGPLRDFDNRGYMYVRMRMSRSTQLSRYRPDLTPVYAQSVSLVNKEQKLKFPSLCGDPKLTRCQRLASQV